MNDYKALIEKLRMAGRWIKHDDGSEETYLLSVDDCVEIADAIEQLVRERNAAIAVLKESADCQICKFYDAEEVVCIAKNCRCGEEWEWRGVQK